jgi:predicted alpha/beta-hydrolase family hydrolase
MEHPLLAGFSDGLAEAGYPTLRFNFPFREKGLNTLDQPEKLEAAWKAAYRYFCVHSGVYLSNIVVAGKSLGALIASQMVAKKRMWRTA